MRRAPPSRPDAPRHAAPDEARRSHSSPGRIAMRHCRNGPAPVRRGDGAEELKMMTDRIWVLGAPDPEMELIESILRGAGEHVEYATVWRAGGRRRVTPAEAYAADVEIGEGLRGLRATAYMVECAPAVLVGSSVDGIDWAGVAVAIDHHRPGDLGYGRPPAEFLPASSIGQVIAELARLDVLPEDWRYVGIHPDDPTYWDRAGELVPLPGGRTVRYWHALGMSYDYRIPADHVLAAAADHCLAAAYRGE